MSSAFNDDILEGDGMSLKGISGGSPSVPKKKGTLRNIKPPGVYVNGKATSKSERSLMDKKSSSSSFSDDPPPPPPPVISETHNESLKIDPTQFEEFEEIMSNGSSQEFRAYSDYSINIREKLELDLNAVLDMLEQSSGEVNTLSTSTHTDKNNNDRLDNLSDGELLKLVEDRNLEVENQLTAVWDELMIKDEASKQMNLSLEKANNDLMESQKKATQEISQNNAKLNMYVSFPFLSLYSDYFSCFFYSINLTYITYFVVI